MTDEKSVAQVWIGVAGVIPREGCELLSPQEGAFVNFLTLARSDIEYRVKVSSALAYYHLELLEFQDIRPLSEADNPAPDILSIATDLEEGQNPKHVRFATFHLYSSVDVNERDKED